MGWCDVQVGALKILREMCASKRVCVTMKQFGGIMSLIDLLQDTDRQVQGLAADVISHLSRLSAARRMLRVYSGIKRLVSALHRHLWQAELTFIHNADISNSN